MPKKPGLTPEQHAETGQALYTMYEQAQWLWRSLKIAYGGATAEKAEKIVKDIEQLRNTLFGKACDEELPEKIRAQIYCPPNNPLQ